MVDIYKVTLKNGGNCMASLNFPDNLFDVNENQIHEDDVIFDGKDYYRIYWNQKQPQVEAFSPTYGYLHNITPSDLSKFKRIGTYKECEYLLIVD